MIADKNILLENYQLNLEPDKYEMAFKLWYMFEKHLKDADNINCARIDNHYLHMSIVVLNTMINDGYLITKRDKNLNIVLEN